VEKSVQFAASMLQVAQPAIYDKYALPKIGIDEWTSLCNLQPSGGKLHILRLMGVSGFSHLKQIRKTLIQAIRIEFPNLSNAILQYSSA
jgi:hypothetical protein